MRRWMRAMDPRRSISLTRFRNSGSRTPSSRKPTSDRTGSAFEITIGALNSVPSASATPVTAPSRVITFFTRLLVRKVASVIRGRGAQGLGEASQSPRTKPSANRPSKSPEAW